MTRFWKVAKTAILDGQEKCQNSSKKDFRNTLKLFYAENGLQKKPDIREMARFLKVGKMAIMHGLSQGKMAYFGTEFKSAKIVAKRTLETH